MLAYHKGQFPRVDVRVTQLKDPSLWTGRTLGPGVAFCNLLRSHGEWGRCAWRNTSCACCTLRQPALGFLLSSAQWQPRYCFPTPVLKRMTGRKAKVTQLESGAGVEFRPCPGAVHVSPTGSSQAEVGFRNVRCRRSGRTQILGWQLPAWAFSLWQAGWQVELYSVEGQAGAGPAAGVV